jgi:hypothetical protein
MTTDTQILELVKKVIVPFIGCPSTPETGFAIRDALRAEALERGMAFSPSFVRFNGEAGRDLLIIESGKEHSFDVFDDPPCVMPIIS